MRLEWTKSGRDWIGIYGQFRAKVFASRGPLGHVSWTLYAGKTNCGSGGTSSIKASKRAAEIAVERVVAESVSLYSVLCCNEQLAQ